MITILNEDNFEATLASSDVVLVDLWASWCGPCRMLSPTVDDNEDVAARYGVRNIPTLLFFKGGQLAERSVGLVSKQEIETILNNLL